jgi:hypothetical protein
VGDALVSAVAKLVEALDAPRAGSTSAGEPATAPTGRLRRLPRAGRDAGVGVARHAVRLPAQAVTGLLDALASEVVPAVLQRLDLNAILDRVDVQRVVDRVDVQAVVRRIDVNEVVGRVEVNEVVARIDVNEVVGRVDVNEAAGRVDLNELAGRVDVNQIAGRVDVNALLATVDVDELVGRVDVGAVTREAMEAIDIGEVIRESTSSLGSDLVDAARVQAMRADDLVARFVDRVLRRSGARETALERPGSAP